MPQRHDGRAEDELRNAEIRPGYLDLPPGSALIVMGRTRVLCTAMVDERVPQFLVGTNQGWITGEYGMIPAATDTRTQREAARGRQSGRTMEIQRLVGRAMRSVIERKALGERTVWIDCEVLQADGGTRTASITGGFVALCLALARLRKDGAIKHPLVHGMVAAVSVGIVEGRAVLDLDYAEDSKAEVDMNVVRTEDGRYIELQGTAEATPFSRAQLDSMLGLAGRGIEHLVRLQREAVGEALSSLLVK